MDRFIFIRRGGFFLNGDFRMFLEKVRVVKNEMTDNAMAICNDTDFVGVTKVAVNVELFYLRIGSSMGRHGGISGFIRVIVIVKVMGFCISFELFDDAVGVFGIVFRDPSFDSGKSKNNHIRFRRIDCLADGFGKVSQLIKNKLEVIEEILFKACEFRSSRDVVKTTELTEASGIVEEY